MQLEDEGQSVPALSNAPELITWLYPYWGAFNTLSSSRQSGFGMGYIPFSEIVCYLNEIDIHGVEEREEWIHWIQFIDYKYVSLTHDKEKKKESKKGKK